MQFEIENIIELKNLKLSFGKRVIIENLNLKVPKASFTTIVGKSGIGKSTLLYVLAGLLRPANGEYFFYNKKVYKKLGFGLASFRRKNIGFLFQDFRLIPFLSVEQNIKMPSYFSGKKFFKKDMDDLIEKLQISNIRRSYPHEISGGEAQRTAIARAMLNRPNVLLLDEPTGNIDDATEKEIIKILQSIQRNGVTLICSTHSKTIAQYSDRVLEIKDKNIQEIQKSNKNMKKRKRNYDVHN